jgi:phage-related protein
MFSQQILSFLGTRMVQSHSVQGLRGSRTQNQGKLINNFISANAYGLRQCLWSPPNAYGLRQCLWSPPMPMVSTNAYGLRQCKWSPPMPMVSANAYGLRPMPVVSAQCLWSPPNAYGLRPMPMVSANAYGLRPMPMVSANVYSLRHGIFRFKCKPGMHIGFC